MHILLLIYVVLRDDVMLIAQVDIHENIRMGLNVCTRVHIVSGSGCTKYMVIASLKCSYILPYCMIVCIIYVNVVT